MAENIDILGLNMCPILLGAIHNCTMYASKTKGLSEEERKKAMIDILAFIYVFQQILYGKTLSRK